MKVNYKGYEVEGSVEEIKRLVRNRQGRKRRHFKRGKMSLAQRKAIGKGIKEAWKLRKKNNQK